MLRRSRHDALLIRVVSAAFGLASLHGACGGAPQRLPVDAVQNGSPSPSDGGAADLPPGTDRRANLETDGPPAQDTPSSADGGPPPDAAPTSDGVVEGGPPADAMLPRAGGGTWQRLPALPSVRQEHGVAVVNGQIFVVGGLAPGAARVDAYDPQTNMWMPHANLPIGVDHPNVAGVGDKLYLLGGTQTGNVFEYNPFAAPPDRRWTMKSALPVARAAGAAGVIGNKVLLAGGRGGGVTAGVDLQIYDTVTDTWQASSRGELPPLPVGRNHLAGVALDGLFYVIGGRSVSTTSTLYNRVDVYDPVARSWSERAPMPTRRGGVSAGVAAGLIIAVGGEGNDRGLNANGVFPQAEAFSPRANTWVSLAPMMTPRHGLGVAGIGDKLYVPGGGTGGGGGGGGDGVSVEHRNLTPLAWAIVIIIFIWPISIAGVDRPRSLIGSSEKITHLTLVCDSTSRLNRASAFDVPSPLMPWFSTPIARLAATRRTARRFGQRLLLLLPALNPVVIEAPRATTAPSAAGFWTSRPRT